MMNDGFGYWRGSLDSAQQALIYATELLGNYIDMCERYIMCERWPGEVHSLYDAYSAAALEFHRVVSELCVRIDQARAQQMRRRDDLAMPGPCNGDFLEDERGGDT